MDYKKIFWGLTLIVFGLAVILRNLGFINFEWYQLWRLWPILLVLWGISMLPVKGFIKLIVSCAVLAGGIYLVHVYDRARWLDNQGAWDRREQHERHREHERSRRNQDERRKDRQADWETQTLNFPYDPAIKSAKLELDAAAGNFEVRSLTKDHLIEFNKEGNIGTYSLTSDVQSNRHVINLSLEDGVVTSHRFRNDVDIKLHPDPAWEFSFDIGAANIDMDFSHFKANNIQIDGGASSIALRIGSKTKETRVTINAGASSITIEVPEGSGCQIITNTVLSAKTLPQFRQIERGHYETEGFADAQNKIFINVDAAVSNLEVRRY